MKERIAVAVSGGVDSSVALHLLKKENYDVTGVFINIWTPNSIPCSAPEDRNDAMRACASVGVPFMEIDATEEYENKVIKPFVDAYKKGDTPNPDIMCNTFIKFGVVYEELYKKGFDKIATGHYAQIQDDDVSKLKRAVDEDKDQTYFMYAIDQGVLDRLILPIGKYTKKEVRDIAKRVNLPAATKPDSTGLCFLGDVSMKEFLSEYIKPVKGDVVRQDTDEVVGKHDGAVFITIGQRGGFTTTENIPFIVVKTDINNNVVYVLPKDNLNGEKIFKLKDVIFRENVNNNLFARYRHRGELCKVEVKDNGKTVEFEEPQYIASGQAIVIYTEEGICIGGGVVK